MAATSKQLSEEPTPTAELTGIVIQLPDAEAKIAELAYYKAEIRGFTPGHELEDWLEAEQEYKF